MGSEDKALLQRIVDEEAEAMGILDGWIQQTVLAYRQRLGADFEDVLQDVRIEVQVLLREGKFRHESGLKHYVQTVARHTCLDWRRALGNQSKYLIDGDYEDLVQQLDDHKLLNHRHPEPAHEQRDLMQRVVAALPEDCWEMWSMILNGFSYTEISQKLGVREGTLRVRVRRCRQKALEMRRELEASPEDSHGSGGTS